MLIVDLNVLFCYSLYMLVYRTLGESDSLASLLVLLFRSLVCRKGSKSFADEDAANSFITSSKREWEYVFAVQICEQYPCLTWLPSLVMLLRQLGIDTLRQELYMELTFVIQFIEHRLQDPEFSLKLDSKEESENIQVETFFYQVDFDQALFLLFWMYIYSPYLHIFILVEILSPSAFAMIDA